MTKEEFLSSLKRKKGYKRCVASPLRYAGGKSLAVGIIAENLPPGIKKIVSPFFGGGSIEIACAKYLGTDIVGYDIFDFLVNYWNYQINKPKELHKILAKLKPNKKEYAKVKEILKSAWLKEKSLPDIKKAAYYYFNHNLSYGPGFLGWMSSIYENEERYQKLLERVKTFNTEGKMKVSQADFKNVIPKHKKDFLYCDPPYYLEGDSKMFRGIYPQRNFPVHHNNFDHKLLADLLKKHKGGFILSYNDCKAVRDIYKGFRIIDVSWQYTMGQGETRIGLNRKNENRGYVKKSHEILILGEKKNA